VSYIVCKSQTLAFALIEIAQSVRRDEGEIEGARCGFTSSESFLKLEKFFEISFQFLRETEGGD
jgi:hypothetical protein